MIKTRLAKELKKLWTIKVTVTPIIVGMLRTIPESLKKKLDKLEIIGRIEIMQTETLLRSARTLRRVVVA